MAAVWRAKVPPNSANLEEARKRVFEFFKLASRSLPTVMDIYNLNDVTTISQLRSSISSQIRKNAHIKDPKGLRDIFGIAQTPSVIVTDRDEGLSAAIRDVFPGY
ncbi:NADH dehydrogenase [ubiquinone] 1 alpha subcomplex subunit 6-like isoform X4 [Amaranthus tricolor]|uniref:NADH dehydrogenase [ubiquinone] 1 alpha subcomplex subunit 6-like isoform X4 n=1 Tax=Amaranthus tricolor TaxID=29722 RepID=UPI00258BB7A7|nr:NADH dehydrogenase [ubiquinone] 1 alpha subcomplex subunit 6-like isoform X4 [Amaranthus tricolor]